MSPGTGWLPKSCLCGFRVIPYGGAKHINKIPRKISGQSRENFVHVFFSLCAFFFAPYKSGKKKAHTHKSFWPVTPPVTGGSPDLEAMGSKFYVLSSDPRNIIFFLSGLPTGRTGDRGEPKSLMCKSFMCLFCSLLKGTRLLGRTDCSHTFIFEPVNIVAGYSLFILRILWEKVRTNFLEEIPGQISQNPGQSYNNNARHVSADWPGQILWIWPVQVFIEFFLTTPCIRKVPHLVKPTCESALSWVCLSGQVSMRGCLDIMFHIVRILPTSHMWIVLPGRLDGVLFRVLLYMFHPSFLWPRSVLNTAFGIRHSHASDISCLMFLFVLLRPLHVDLDSFYPSCSVCPFVPWWHLWDYVRHAAHISSYIMGF